MLSQLVSRLTFSIFLRLCICFAANFMLEDTYERHVVGNKYGDIPLGLYIIRGENVVLLGEIVSIIVRVSACILVWFFACVSTVLATNIYGSSASFSLQDDEKHKQQTLLTEVSVEEILELESAKIESGEKQENVWSFDQFA